MEDCVFCRIVSGEIPAAKVYEDDSVLAFLDANPDTPGHTLVVPKQHFENVFDIDESALQKVVAVGKRLAVDMKKNLNAVGINLANNNGKHAHQIVFHFHLHVIPRYENDGLEMYGPRNKEQKPTAEELEIIAEKIKQ
jgi:histidine triad (HIT) family protein